MKVVKSGIFLFPIEKEFLMCLSFTFHDCFLFLALVAATLSLMRISYTSRSPRRFSLSAIRLWSSSFSKYLLTLPLSLKSSVSKISIQESSLSKSTLVAKRLTYSSWRSWTSRQFRILRSVNKSFFEKSLIKALSQALTESRELRFHDPASFFPVSDMFVNECREYAVRIRWLQATVW